ncbi:hypothetical protein HPB52_011444 [Rhipicephalus sanguineus]|uniref:Brinker DNA-binding domain-containing protein n=1 Tax=Rhipicephalus sanguineus TaxID=34632 RepID=A0A9D4SND9_RHISA|nr:hypothetical protein HPB52_011444 [Rhipicephalus sanguineus]
MAPNERSHYSAAYKRKVVLAAESSSNVQAGRDFGVDEKNVRRWRGQREKLFVCTATRMTFTGPRKGRHPEMKAALADFVRMQRAAALPVTTEVLQATARALSREQGELGHTRKVRLIFDWTCVGKTLKGASSLPVESNPPRPLPKCQQTSCADCLAIAGGEGGWHKCRWSSALSE